MTLLILGLFTWVAGHLLRRLAPELRAAVGDLPGKAILAVLLLAAVVMMVRGYQSAPVIDLWHPPAFLRHVNNLLMLVAVFLFLAGKVPGRVRARVRHPMLAAVKIWGFAHLLVNGDLASVILFGGLMTWAVVSLSLINRQEPVWNRPAPGPLRNDLIWGAAALGLFAAIGHVHGWLGHPVFG